MIPSASSELIVNAQNIRARLRNPSNAVRDDGIDLKRLPRGFELVSERRPLIPPVQIIKIEQTEEVQSVPVNAPSRPPVTLSSFFISRQIIDVVAAAYDLNAEALRSSVRTARFVVPRHIAMYLMRIIIKPERSLPWIGRQFGGRDHTTILSALRKIEVRLHADPALAAEIAAFKSRIHTTI